MISNDGGLASVALSGVVAIGAALLQTDNSPNTLAADCCCSLPLLDVTMVLLPVVVVVPNCFIKNFPHMSRSYYPFKRHMHLCLARSLAYSYVATKTL